MNKLLKSLIIVSIFISVANAKQPLTLEDIAKTSQVNTATISPDGNWIAYTKSKPRTPYVDDDGRAWSELYIVATQNPKLNKPFITGKVGIGNISWGKKSKKIYFTTKRNDDKKPSLYAIPVDGGEAQKVLSFNNGVGKYSINHDGTKVIFISKPKQAAHVKDLKKKGFKAKVYEEGLRLNQLWLADLTKPEPKAKVVKFDKHLISAEFSPVNDNVLVRQTGTSLIDDVYMKSLYQVIDLKGNVKSTFKTEGKLGKAAWSRDGKLVAFLGANDYNDPTAGALYVANAKTGSLYKRKSNENSHYMDLAWGNKDLYFIEHKDAESQIVKADPAEKGAQTTVIDYGHSIQSSLSLSSNDTLVYKANTATHPNEIYVGKNRLTDSNPWLKDIKFGKQEVFNYSARDGMSLQGVLVYPVNYKKGKRYPMIAFVHGGPEAHRSNGWNTRYSDPLQVVAGEGYFAFVPNYRGSTGRGDSFTRAGQHGYAGPEFNDILDGKLELVKKGMVDSDKVGITGGSYGGYATAWGATALSEHYAAGVMFVGISNQLSKFGTTDIPNEMNAVHARAWPWDDYQWMLETSPIFHVKKSKTPLLILHGENDTRVHPSQSMELYRYLKTLDQAPVRLVLYPGEGHGNRKAAAQYDYSLRFMRWMDHYLKGKGGKAPSYDLKHEDRLKKNK